MQKAKAIFLTHPQALKSEVTGGVQLCSQEFHYIIEHIDDIELQDYNVGYTRSIADRVQIRMGMENYSSFNIKKDIPELLSFIEKEHISLVFINMASLVRYAKPIKERFGSKVKTIMLSHGNNSGDFLHLISKPISSTNALKNLLKKIRLGLLIATESEHRVKYLDSVITLSETERQIENWFGGKSVVFVPRRLYDEFLDHQPVVGRIGFVGRLDHPPNLQGVSILFDEMIRQQKQDELEIRIVGAPPEYGEILRKKYPFITYTGELSDADLEKEVATWSFLLNPVWWYSTGASTKLAKAISWGVPIISTTAGMRGYEWKAGALLMADSPQKMVEELLANAKDTQKINYWRDQVRTIAKSGYDVKDLAALIRNSYQ
jgi:glycosyltransferase involved in cell wall biosynthesis